MFLPARRASEFSHGLGHLLPIHSAPVSNNVRYASDSDHLRHESEFMLCAHSNAIMRDSAGHRALRTNRNGLMGTLAPCSSRGCFGAQSEIRSGYKLEIVI